MARKFDLTEEKILTCFALRFNGYQYLEENSFDPQKALDDFINMGEWTISPLEQLACFFFLQRYLSKWGGERLPKNSKHWQAYRELFLLTNSYDIPAVYRLDNYFEEWRSQFEPRQAECVDLIEKVHSSTPYDDLSPSRDRE